MIVAGFSIQLKTKDTEKGNRGYLERKGSREIWGIERLHRN